MTQNNEPGDVDKLTADLASARTFLDQLTVERGLTKASLLKSYIKGELQDADLLQAMEDVGLLVMEVNLRNSPSTAQL